jgi:hypothetical protein
MSPAVCPLSAPGANHRIDPTSQIDRHDRTTPVQQSPRTVPDPARVLRRRRSPLVLARGGVLVALVVVVEALIL